MNEEIKPENMRIHSRADELIACLEGEIAKRDEELASCRVAVENCEVFRARIAELEDDLKCAHSMLCEVSKSGMVLRTELAALKAQEPVLPCELDLESSFSCAEKEASLHAGVRDTFYFALIECLQKNKLYRAPAQKELSVVMPERKKAHNCEGIEFWKANGWNDCLDELASIYAAPVSEAKAQGVVMPERAVIREVFMRNGFTIKEGQDDLKPYVYAAAEELLQLAAPAQQVSVPDGWRELAKRADDFLYSLPETDGVLRLRADLCSMLAAPAAPAADAGLVEALDYQALFDAIAAATSVYANGAINISVQAFRDALAAHRAQELTKEPSHD